MNFILINRYVWLENATKFYFKIILVYNKKCLRK